MLNLTNMKTAILLLLTCIFIFASLNAAAQKAKVSTPQKQIATAEKEVREFFESYGEDLRLHRREAIADRYDRRGAYLMGNGGKDLVPFEAVKDRYLNKWPGPKSFQWKDLSFEMLSPAIAVVLGKFEWQRADDKVFNYSYTGVLVKRDGRWRIRVEDESGTR
jgi:hypothetical protein